MNILVVIPSRLASTRLFKKPLLEIHGKPLIQHAYEGAKQSKLATKLIVATDSEEIMRCVENFGGEAMMTSSEHKTGSDRVSEVAEKMPEYPVVINVQGDVMALTGEMVDALVRPLIEYEDIQMSALKAKITNKNELFDPAVIKVVTDKHNIALYYSRLPIPYNRDGIDTVYYRNKGVYGFKRDFLLQYNKMMQTNAEKAESLEQLRALEHGVKVYVTEVNTETFDINTEDDYKNAKRRAR